MNQSSFYFGSVWTFRPLPAFPAGGCGIVRSGPPSWRRPNSGPPAWRRPTLSLRAFRPRKLRAETPKRLPSSIRLSSSGLLSCGIRLWRTAQQASSLSLPHLIDLWAMLPDRRSRAVEIRRTRVQPSGGRQTLRTFRPQLARTESPKRKRGSAPARGTRIGSAPRRGTRTSGSGATGRGCWDGLKCPSAYRPVNFLLTDRSISLSLSSWRDRRHSTATGP
jgi:hypothetical protein